MLHGNGGTKRGARKPKDQQSDGPQAGGPPRSFGLRTRQRRRSGSAEQELGPVLQGTLTAAQTPLVLGKPKGPIGGEDRSYPQQAPEDPPRLLTSDEILRLFPPNHQGYEEGLSPSSASLAQNQQREDLPFADLLPAWVTTQDEISRLPVEDTETQELLCNLFEKAVTIKRQRLYP